MKNRSGYGRKINSRPAPVAPSFTTFSAPDIHYEGSTTAAPSFTYTGTEPITATYQWQTSVDSNTWSDIGGATSATSPAWVGADAGVYKRASITLTGPGGTTTQVANGSAVVATGTGGGGGGGPADIGDWTTPVPVTVTGSTFADRVANSQVGSRLFYIDSVDGADPTTDTEANRYSRTYFWNGTNIIDSDGNTAPTSGPNMGTPYGTDPFAPSVAVLAHKTWSYCATRYQSSNWPIGSLVTAGQFGGNSINAYTYSTGGRANKPDWWLFKRGTTINLTTDGTPYGYTDGVVINVSGGASAAAPCVFGAYGTGARPRFITPHKVSTREYFIYRNDSGGDAVTKHIRYLSIHLDGHTRKSGSLFSQCIMNYQTANAIDVLFEDVLFDSVSCSYTDGGSPLGVGGEIKERRCIRVDTFTTSTDHQQGIYLGYGGNTFKFQVEDSIYSRCGYSSDPSLTWPLPSDLFNRNFYLSGKCDHVNSWIKNTVSLMGASGDQYRLGLYAEGNFYNLGYVSNGNKGGDTVAGPSGSIKNNVLQVYYSPTGNVYGGFGISSGADTMDVSGNIITTAAVPSGSMSSLLAPFFINSISAAQPPNTWVHPTRDNVISGNIAYFEGKALNVASTDGCDGSPQSLAGYSANIAGRSFTWGTTTVYNWQYPGVENNTISGNIFVGTSANTTSYSKLWGATAPFAEGTDLNTYGANTHYTTSAAAVTGEGWTDPTRTLYSYLISLGHTITPAGSETIHEAAVRVYTDYVRTNMRRGQWDYDYTAQAIVNYVRAGFNMVAI